MISIKRTLAISDIHGCYDEFNALLDEVEFDPINDKLILLGDYIDRGKDSRKVVQQVIELVENHNAIALKGNHDDMLIQWLSNPTDLTRWYFENGGFETVKSYIITAERDIWCWDTYVKWVNTIKENFADHVEFLEKLPLYHEDDEHIYVHAGIRPDLDDWKQSKDEDFIWIRDMFLDREHQQDKFVVHGHTPCIHLHSTEDIFFGDMKISIDGACAYGMQLNCLEINEDGYKTHFVESNKKGLGW